MVSNCSGMTTSQTATLELGMWTAVYVKDTLACLITPTRFNMNDVEITVTVLKHPIPNLHIIAIYRSNYKS